MNNHDSEKIAGILEENGYKQASQVSQASLVLVNTCNVRPKAVNKAYSQLGIIRKFKKKNPDLIIGVCGCLSQTEKEKIFSRASGVDLVFGTQNIDSLPALIERVKKHRTRQIEIVSVRKNLSFEHGIARKDNVRAWVTIMEGCDNFCAYCIVPFTRGREISRSPNTIFSEVRLLVNKGYKEIGLLGQNVNSYGLKESFPMDFPELLHYLHSIDGLKRIRFVTSHPKDFSENLINAMANLEKVCNQIHLPVQSGSNRILSKMQRKYTREEYLEKISLLKEKVCNVGITSDIIVGFPGETEKDFEDTMSLLNIVRYDGLFSFKYSDRPNTKAANMTDKIEESVIQTRFIKLLELQNRISAEKNMEEVGTLTKVMVEGPSKNDSSLVSGRSEKNKIVHFAAQKPENGEIFTVKITEGKTHCLMGEML